MDVGTERVVSRLHVHCSVHRAVLDVRVAGGVPEFARPGTVALAVRADPMAGVIDGFRWAVTRHGQPPGPLLQASAAGVAVVLLSGLFFFNRMESNIADRV